MNTASAIQKESAIRFAVIAAMAIGFGFAVHGKSAFDPYMTAFGFLVSGVTIGIAYATFRSSMLRNGFAALFIWYILLTCLVIHSLYLWNFVMEATHLVLLTCAVWFYFVLLGKGVVSGRIRRIIAAAVIIGAAHGLIVVVLQILRFHILSDVSRTIEGAYNNLKRGTVIGVLSGAGMELAEYLITKIAETEPSPASEQSGR